MSTYILSMEHIQIDAQLQKLSEPLLDLSELSESAALLPFRRFLVFVNVLTISWIKNNSPQHFCSWANLKIKKLLPLHTITELWCRKQINKQTKRFCGEELLCTHKWIKRGRKKSASLRLDPLIVTYKKKSAKRSASLGHHVYDRYLYSSETAVPASVIVLCTAISCATLLVSEIIKKKKKRMHARAHSHLIHIHTLSLSHTHTRACARARTHTWITEKSQIKWNAKNPREWRLEVRIGLKRRYRHITDGFSPHMPCLCVL